MRNLLLAALAILTLTSCDTRRRTITAPIVAETGTYTLQSVNGLPLPVTVQRTSNTTKDVLADTLVLLAGGNARRVYYLRTTTKPDTITATDTVTVRTNSTASTGLYKLSGTTIDLSDFGFVTGTYSAGMLTLKDATNTYVYHK